ncbi:MAG TPA: tetratricopeptide repeat protein, partial [Candidatus Polarisedimenticolia bacterium]|nr:tetratricopeptide repeat protein [Candidatus Polarisedimenticolia bacterium]
VESMRSGSPQIESSATAPAPNEAAAEPTTSEAAAAQPAETKESKTEDGAAQAVPEKTPEESTAKNADAAPEKPAQPDMSAFIEALRAAERTNENLTLRLAQMEAAAAKQRADDQAFIRDMIRGVLLLSGGMAALGLLALVAIVYLQVRSTKQQAITFAAQLQALTSHVALPGPGAVASPALKSSKSHFDSTARNIEEKLSDLESIATGLPASQAGLRDSSVPNDAASGQREFGFSTQTAAVRGEKASELLARANSLLMQQQPEVALAYLDQAISRNPHDSEAHLKRGSALERLNRLDEALASYDRAIESEPTLSVAFLAKAGVLNKLQRYGEALKCYEVALAQQGGLGESESPAA